MSFSGFKQHFTSFYNVSQVGWCAEGVLPNPSSQATLDLHSLAEMITKWLYVVSLAYALALSIPRCTTAKRPRLRVTAVIIFCHSKLLQYLPS